MKPLALDEKLAMVMVYTRNLLARGHLVAKETSRVSIWLRTQGVPTYLHLHNPQVVSFSGTPPKPVQMTEVFIPTVEVIAFHIVPPDRDPMDYDTSEANRIMQPTELLIGPFVAKANIRISSATDVATSLEVSRASWLSIYDAEITCPFLPQFKVNVPMMLVNPSAVSFGIM